MKHYFKIHYYEELESTNTTLKEMAKNGADEGTAVVAYTQTGGRGRLGRSFYSPKGGLYLSLLLKPEALPETAIQITACAAVAVAEAIEKVTGFECGIKWVNDIFLNGKKICGILTEGAIDAQSGKLDYAILGIGVNVYKSDNGFPKELNGIAGAIYNKKPKNDITQKLTEEIISSFFALYSKLDKKTYLNEYRRRSILTGKEITYSKDGITHSGKVLDIDNNAALVVEESGKTIKISAGEVSVKLK